MRALAEFIMRGRAQAALVAVLGSLLPFISPATVALISLRKGAFEGTQVLFWALVPMIVVGLFARGADASVLLLLYAGVGMLLVVYGSALVLRATASWTYALGGLVALSFVCGALMPVVAPTLSNTLLEQLNRDMAEITQGAPAAGNEVPALGNGPENAEQASGETQTSGLVEETPAPRISIPNLAGVVAFITGYQVLFSLILGRWWQALLYNPGGFRQEFHGLRLSQTQGLIFFGLMAVATPQFDYQSWAYLFALPLLVVGTALVHSWAAAKGLGGQWLFFYYLALVFLIPLSGIVIALLGFADSWIDIRKRFGAGGPPAPKA